MPRDDDYWQWTLAILQEFILLPIIIIILSTIVLWLLIKMMLLAWRQRVVIKHSLFDLIQDMACVDKNGMLLVWEAFYLVLFNIFTDGIMHDSTNISTIDTQLNGSYAICNELINVNQQSQVCRLFMHASVHVRDEGNWYCKLPTHAI